MYFIVQYFERNCFFFFFFFFFYQCVTSCDFPKIVGFSLNERSLQLDTEQSGELETFSRVL